MDQIISWPFLPTRHKYNGQDRLWEVRGRREGLREDVAVVLSLRVKPHDAVWRTYRTFRKEGTGNGSLKAVPGLLSLPLCVLSVMK